MRINLLTLLIFLTLTVVSCKDDIPDKSLNGTISCNMECKTDSDLEKAAYNYTSVMYNYDSETKVLTLKHINAGFNCCPDRILTHLIYSNNSLFIEEVETNPKCNCSCLFDVDIKVEGVDQNTDSIWFIEPYIGSQTWLRFGVNFSLKKQDTVTVKRTQYPWN